LDNEIGSIEVGKKADLVFLDLEKSNHHLNDENIYSNIIYSATAADIHNVMIDGDFVIRKGESLIYDEEELYSNGKNELMQLLKRAKVN